MNIYVSNRLEILSDHLADRLTEGASSALATETIILQSLGMAKWLSLQLARRNGICANCSFPFPNRFLDDVYRAFIDGYEPDAAYDRDVMTWTLDGLLRDVRDPEFAPVNQYLSGGDPLKRYQLARNIALLFDQYLIFRPDMMLQWETQSVSSDRDGWQATLWRRLVEKGGPWHKARLRQIFLSSVSKAPIKNSILPSRLFVFGISYLPPYHLDILYHLAGRLPVFFYYLNPTSEFWADIQSAREMTRVVRKARARRTLIDAPALHLESGNSLLASWGTIGRDFFTLIADAETQVVEFFDAPQRRTLLESVQNDIYALREGAGTDEDLPVIAADDNSLTVHCCHSPLREVETVHDLLLSFFERDRDLKPSDIVVMSPDMGTYAPYIDAVFQTRRPSIPFSVVERRRWDDNRIALALFSIFNAASGRFTIPDVMKILEMDPLRKKFDLSADDLETIAGWLHATRIRWGINVHHRQEMGLPAFDENTWQSGIDRMLAGVMLDGRREDRFAGLLPYGGIEGEATQLLGRFLMYWDLLLGYRTKLKQSHTLVEWVDTLRHLLDKFFPAGDEFRSDLYAFYQILDGLDAQTRRVDDHQKYPLEVIQGYLEQSLPPDVSAAGFLAGGVSFCALLPMRSLPFKVIVLLGMNAGVFPRREKSIGFDLMRDRRKTGDRSLRHDDQYLFLESLISARDKLVMTYTGRDLQDASERQPSDLINELLEYVDRFYRGENKDIPVSKQITTSHRLHAFHPDYFTPASGYASYSETNYEAARAVVGPRRDVSPVFISGKLREEVDVSHALAIEDLFRFYRNPARYFLQNRLRMKWDDKTVQAQTSEPFDVDTLDRYGLRLELAERFLAGAPTDEVYENKKAAGVLPVGSACDYFYTKEKNRASRYARRIEKFTVEEPKTLTINIRAAGITLSGIIRDVGQDRYLCRRPARLKMSDYLNAWISHLLIVLSRPKRESFDTLLLGEADNEFYRFLVPDHPEVIVEDFIGCYYEGQCKPLKFFPLSSLAYADTLWRQKRTKQEAFAAARKVWKMSGLDKPGEGMQYEHLLCFGSEPPLDEEFQQFSEVLLAPLFAHLEAIHV